MTYSSKQFTSITSFISYAINLKEIRFPQQQLNQYCKQNDCSFDKILNVYHSYHHKFKSTYSNFNQLILLLSIALKKIELRFSTFGDKQKQETEVLLRKSLEMLQDLITSKMLLVCLASKGKQNQIYQYFLYTKGFLNLLIPQLMLLSLFNQIIEVIEGCNKLNKANNLVSINFLVEVMFISTIIDHLTEQSEHKFKTIVMDLIQQKKKIIFNLLWSLQKTSNKILEFKEIAYLRLDVESPKVYCLQITNEGKIVTNDRNIFQPEDWIINAYQRHQNPSIWKVIKIQTALDIYQFLFKLEVFASSPHIEDLDSLIPSNQQFLDLFSKFLMGQSLHNIDQQAHKNPTLNKNNSSMVINNLTQIKKIFDGVDKPYKNVVKQQLSKIFAESSSGEDDQKSNNLQFHLDI